jgi:hypothetical protein
MLEAMLESSMLDERLLRFQRQGRIGFYLTAWGEEATLIGPTFALRPTDWIFSCYREQAVALFRGYPMRTMMCQLYGNAEDPVKGHQLPAHHTARDLNFMSVSSVVGTQIPHASAWRSPSCAVTSQWSTCDSPPRPAFREQMATKENCSCAKMLVAATPRRSAARRPWRRAVPPCGERAGRRQRHSRLIQTVKAAARPPARGPGPDRSDHLPPGRRTSSDDAASIAIWLSRWPGGERSVKRFRRCERQGGGAT